MYTTKQIFDILCDSEIKLLVFDFIDNISDGITTYKIIECEIVYCFGDIMIRFLKDILVTDNYDHCLTLYSNLEMDVHNCFIPIQSCNPLVNKYQLLIIESSIIKYNAYYKGVT